MVLSTDGERDCRSQRSFARTSRSDSGRGKPLRSRKTYRSIARRLGKDRQVASGASAAESIRALLIIYSGAATRKLWNSSKSCSGVTQAILSASHRKSPKQPGRVFLTTDFQEAASCEVTQTSSPPQDGFAVANLKRITGFRACSSVIRQDARSARQATAFATLWRAKRCACYDSQAYAPFPESLRVHNSASISRSFISPAHFGRN